MRYWGSEDSELSMRTWLLGYRVVCEPSIRVGHTFREEHPYHIAWFDELYNKARFGESLEITESGDIHGPNAS